MAKDFEQIGHKNLELLRFYLSKDIREIDKKIQKDESELLGCIIASLVDIFVVIFFDDALDCMISRYTDSTLFSILCKVLCIVLLLALFAAVRKSFLAVQDWKLRKQRESRRSQSLPETQLKIIDSFDNIACDGLLICQHYIKKYNEEEAKYVKLFYFYEIIHHLRKAEEIYDVIDGDLSTYVSPSPKTLDPYRVNNFIDFANEIFKFIEETVCESSELSMTGALKRDIDNLGEKIKTWTKVQET